MLNDKNLKSVADAVAQVMAEALKGNQHKIDKNKNNKIDAHDFKLLRKEGWDDMVKTAQDSVKSGPKPSGGAGVKQGTRYGGGKQKDEKPVKEEASQAEFTAELKKAQAKAAGQAKQADVAKPAVQAVQNEETHTKIEVLDLTDVNDVKMSTIELDERHLSSDEKSEVEKNVKGMKKNLAGFKERYGKDAKNVMYGAATNQAKGE
jgi:hypothetical protein